MIDDRENDWLAQEMRREGYHGLSSNLDVEHQKEEHSFGWNAGAFAIKQEHAKNHGKEPHSNDPYGNKRVYRIIVILILLVALLGRIFWR